jgi:hypothetical protein
MIRPYVLKPFRLRYQLLLFTDGKDKYLHCPDSDTSGGGGRNGDDKRSADIWCKSCPPPELLLGSLELDKENHKRTLMNE